MACAVVPPAHPPTFLETGGLPLYPRRGLRPLHPAWGTGVWFRLALSFSGGIGLACAVVPPAHPPTLLETGGPPLYPRRGLRPLQPPSQPDADFGPLVELREGPDEGVEAVRAGAAFGGPGAELVLEVFEAGADVEDLALLVEGGDGLGPDELASAGADGLVGD